MPGQFIPYPQYTGFLSGKKRGVNTNPHTHNKENFQCGPTNLNDPLFPLSRPRRASMNRVAQYHQSVRWVRISLRPHIVFTSTDWAYSRRLQGLQYCQLIILESSLSVCLIVSYSEIFVKRKYAVKSNLFKRLSVNLDVAISSSLTSNFLLGPNPFSHYLNSTTLNKLCQALFLLYFKIRYFRCIVPIT